MTARAPEAFWTFATGLYAGPGVGEACLWLQDAHGADVNLLLFAAWLAVAHRRTIGIEDAARLDAAVADWRREVVQAIRAVRRHAKTLAGNSKLAPAYAALKRCELDAERAQHALMLAEGLPGRPDERASARANMLACLAAAGIAPDAAVMMRVEHISDLAKAPPDDNHAARPKTPNEDKHG